MKRYIHLLCGITALLPSVNTDAVENNSTGLMTAQSYDAADVGRHLREREISRNSLDKTPQIDRIAQPNDTQPSGLDLWLMALAGAGLIVLQLRRKQKSLPQRPLIPTDYELDGGVHAQRHTDVVVNFASHS